VVDRDAIYNDRLNFRLYSEISKFFDTVLMNFPRNISDLIDSLVAGGFRIVISPRTGELEMQKYMEITDQIVVPASGNVESFRRLGGRYAISDGMTLHGFDLLYNTGTPLKGDQFCNIKGFPNEIKGLIRA